MWEVFEIMAQNMGLGFDTIVDLMLFTGSIIFFALDVKTGLLVLLLISAGVFVWFYSVALNWAVPLTIFFIDLVFLALSLYASGRKGLEGGVI